MTIAEIRGRARGLGSEFALACDLRFASREKAVFGQPEVGTGLVPGGGSIEMLSALDGRSRALEIILGSDDFDGIPDSQPGRGGRNDRTSSVEPQKPQIIDPARRVAN